MEIFGSMEDPEVRACVERLKSLGYNVIVVPDHQTKYTLIMATPTKRKWILDDTQWLHIAENNGLYGPCVSSGKAAGVHVFRDEEEYVSGMADMLKAVITEYADKSNGVVVQVRVGLTESNEEVKMIIRVQGDHLEWIPE